MAERAHPDSKGFRNKFFGLIKNKWRSNLFLRYLFCNDYIKNKVILDIPCGMGWGTSLLKEYNKCFGVDIDKDSIIEAKKRYKSDNLNFEAGDLVSINFKNDFFDVVICLEGFEHITFLEGQKFLGEARRILKKDGLLILSSPLLIDNKYHSGNKYHLCEYKKEELTKIVMDAGFSIQETKYLNTPEKSKIIILVLKNEKS